MKPMSRQQRWQLKQKANGRCITCGQPRHPDSANHCATHHLAQRKLTRKYNHVMQPWQPGDPGRPQKVVRG